MSYAESAPFEECREMYASTRDAVHKLIRDKHDRANVDLKALVWGGALLAGAVASVKGGYYAFDYIKKCPVFAADLHLNKCNAARIFGAFLVPAGLFLAYKSFVSLYKGVRPDRDAQEFNYYK